MPDVVWKIDIPGNFDLEAAIRSAAFEPKDPNVCVGILEVSWNGHPEGALVVTRKSRHVRQPFLVSRDSVTDLLA